MRNTTKIDDFKHAVIDGYIREGKPVCPVCDKIIAVDEASFYKDGAYIHAKDECASKLGGQPFSEFL